MNLEEFVSETMRQIIAGVKKAQAGEDGANVTHPSRIRSAATFLSILPTVLSRASISTLP